MQHFHEQQQAKIGKKIKQKLRATPWGWTFAVWKSFAFFIQIYYPKLIGNILKKNA